MFLWVESVLWENDLLYNKNIKTPIHRLKIQHTNKQEAEYMPQTNIL